MNKIADWPGRMAYALRNRGTYTYYDNLKLKPQSNYYIIIFEIWNIRENDYHLRKTLLCFSKLINSKAKTDEALSNNSIFSAIILSCLVMVKVNLQVVRENMYFLVIGKSFQLEYYLWDVWNTPSVLFSTLSFFSILL